MTLLPPRAALLCPLLALLAPLAPLDARAETYEEEPVSADEGGERPDPGDEWERAREEARQRLTVGPFRQGRLQLSLGAGGAALGGGDYIAIQAQVGVFVLDGLLAQLGAQYWLSRSDLPSAYLLAPGLTYYLYQLHPFAPYAGGFYQRLFVDLPVTSPDAVGARLGAAYRLGGGGLLSLGARYLLPLSCAAGETCGEWLPEVSLQIGL